jgi:hypothetical protein
MRQTITIAVALILACDGGRKSNDASADAGMADTGGSDMGNEGRASKDSDIDSDIDGGLAPTSAQLTVTPTQALLQTTADTSANLAVLVKNTGGLATGPLLMSMAGPDASEFQIFRENCPTGLDPGRSCAVFLTFEPPTISPDPNLGAQATARLMVVDSEASGSAVTVDIGVTILVASDVLAILGPTDMGTVPLGGSGANLPFIVVNTGTNESGPLQVSISSSQFGRTADACSGSFLASAATCTFSIQFSPTELGVQRAIVTVQGSANDGVASELIVGTCVAP